MDSGPISRSLIQKPSIYNRYTRPHQLPNQSLWSAASLSKSQHHIQRVRMLLPHLKIFFWDRQIARELFQRVQVIGQIRAVDACLKDRVWCVRIGLLPIRSRYWPTQGEHRRRQRVISLLYFRRLQLFIRYWRRTIRWFVRNSSFRYRAYLQVIATAYFQHH
jgi:hypothetical protein